MHIKLTIRTYIHCSQKVPPYPPKQAKDLPPKTEVQIMLAPIDRKKNYLFLETFGNLPNIVSYCPITVRDTCDAFTGQ